MVKKNEERGREMSIAASKRERKDDSGGKADETHSETRLRRR